MIVISKAYAKTFLNNHLYEKAFSYLDLKDNTSWWLGKNYILSKIDSNIIMYVIYFILMILSVELSYLNEQILYFSAIIIGTVLFGIVVNQLFFTAKRPSAYNYSVVNIKEVMNDFREHKDRLKGLYDLSDVTDVDAFLDNKIDEAEAKWIKAYENGYH